MKRTTWPLACGLALLGGVCGGAAAADDKGGLDALDANDDGVISRQEAVSAQVASFHRLDADGDGIVSRDELEPAQPSPDSETPDRDTRRARENARERWFANLDRDDSDGISVEEYQAAMTPYFDRLDANGDGQIDARELRQAYTRDDAER